MAITIGLDFGTHQTKICIENSDSPYHRTYEFYEWEKGVYAFPSIIQINKDHTLRYGSVDLATCLIGRKKKSVANPGELILPPKPVEPNLPILIEPKLPSHPIHTFVTAGGITMSIPYKDLYGIGRPLPKKGGLNPIKKWEEKCKKLTTDYERRKKTWVRKKLGRLGIPLPVEPVLPPKPHTNQIETENSEAVDTNLIATDSQKKEYREWVIRCASIKRQYREDREQQAGILSKYKEDLKNWKEKCDRISRTHALMKQRYEESLREYPMVFKFFKQATFSAYDWDYEIKPQDLTVLYLANIIFRLEDRFGTDFSIQMGVPASKETFGRLKSLASGYLIQAIRLVDDIFQNNYEKFLATPFEELLSLIPKFEYSDDLKTLYALIVLPEAYAALRSLTANSRIPSGMSIMLDMGGGTTDISFFLIEENGEPQVCHYESIAKGLNFFLEYEDRHNFRSIDFTTMKELKDIPKDVFSKAFKEYKGNIDAVIKRLTNFLHQDSISRGREKSAFRYAIDNRPVIYTGGGCYDRRMRMPILNFSDVIYINKRILNIPNVVEGNKVTIPYSMMATAFGLSISKESDEIQISNKEDVFAHISKTNTSEDHWNAHREHGMYED